MTTYHPTEDRLTFSAPLYGNAVKRTLDDLIALDAPPVRVNADGTIDTDLLPIYRAPDALPGDDEDLKRTADAAGWEALEGFTGQHGYRGLVMHPSEYIGGGLADHILSTPGVYTATTVDDEDGESLGWVVLRWVGRPEHRAAYAASEAKSVDELDDVAPLAAGDRVEIGGRERIVTSVISRRHGGRRTLNVTHTAPGEPPQEFDVTVIPLPLETYVGPTSSTPHVLAARALASAANTLRPAGALIPETPASARREYVEARGRGEGVALALSRARLEMVADAVLSPTDDFSGWDVDPDELARVTRSPELDALSGTATDAATGQRLLFPLDVPDGIALTVSTERDDHSDRPEDEDCYSPEDVAAWREDEWEFRTVAVTATDANGDEVAAASLGGMGVGNYWPGTEGAQVWHAVPELIREVLADLPDAAHVACAYCEGCDAVRAQPEPLPMTCGTCGHRYADNTPAGRCPREADHEDERTCSRCGDAVGYLSSRDLCDACEAAPSRYRVRYNFTRAANGYHFTEWFDTLDEAREYVDLAARFGELVILGIEDEDGEPVAVEITDGQGL